MQEGTVQAHVVHMGPDVSQNRPFLWSDDEEKGSDEVDHMINVASAAPRPAGRKPIGSQT